VAGSGNATSEGKTYNWKIPNKSLWLFVPVPARYEAYFSFYTLCVLSSEDE